MDARIFAEVVVQKAVADVHRPYGFGAGFEQAVRKSSMGRADIQTDISFYRNAKGIECASQLIAAA